MDTLICAGGTGARVMEAVIHLCGAGLGPKALRVFSIDGDSAHGNLLRVRELAKAYARCASQYAGSGYFSTELHIIGDELKSWNPMRDETLFDLLKHELQSQPQFREVLDLLFDEQEQKTNLSGGYKARPAIGAAALAMLEDPTGKNGKSDERSPTQDSAPEQALIHELLETLKGDLNTQAITRVFLAGSVFGGTGASALHPVSRFIKTVLAKNKHDKIKIGAAALVPYFQFFGDPGPKEIKVDAENFDLATKTAAEFYHHLSRSGDWHFDSMYWIGYDHPRTVKFGKWGNEQTNPAHFVDLLAAFACLDFLEDTRPGGKTYYAGSPAKAEVIDWAHVPGANAEKKGLAAWHRLTGFFLSGVMHHGWIQPHFADMQHKPRTVPWYKTFFADRKQGLDVNTMNSWNKFLAQHERWWLEIQEGEGAGASRFHLLPNEAKQTSDVEQDGKRTKVYSVDYTRPHLLFPAGSRIDPTQPLFYKMQHAMSGLKENKMETEIQELINMPTPGARYVRLLRVAAERIVREAAAPRKAAASA